MSYLKLPSFLSERPFSSLIFSYNKETLKKPTGTYFQYSAAFKLCVKGEGRLKIDDQSYEISRNTLLFIPPCSDISWTRIEKKLEIESFSFNFSFFYFILRTYTTLGWAEADVVGFLKKNACLKLSNWIYYNIFDLFKAIQIEVLCEENYEGEDKRPFSGLFILSLLFQLAIFYFRGQNKKARHAHACQEALLKENPQCLMSYLMTNLDKADSREETARNLNFSPPALDRIFKNTYGYTYNEILSLLRFKRAYVLLVYSDYTLDQIAKDVGFSDRANFNHSFQKIIGQSPDHFRKDLKNQPYKDLCFWSSSGLVTEILSFFSQQGFKPGFRPSQAESALHLPSRRIKASLKSYTGLSPMDYLDFIKIAEASKLLEEDQEKSIEKIAWSLGYKSVKTFYRKFKKWKKISPGEYRKLHQKKNYQMTFRDLGFDF